jgi:hypothetical protein
MDSTRAIADYAAVLSTAVFAWNLGRQVSHARRRMRLLLTFDRPVYVGDMLVRVTMHLRITNLSSIHSIEIVGLEFAGASHGWHGADANGRLRPLDEGGILPIWVKPAETESVPIRLGARGVEQFYWVRGISVRDSDGRGFRVSRRQIGATKEQIRRAVAAAPGGAPFSIWVQRPS